MDAYSYIDSVAGINMSQGPDLSQLIHSSLTTNLEYDKEKTEAQLEEAYKLALAPHGVKLTGERIIDYGEIVTAQKYALIKTYERMSAERNINNAVRRFSVLGNLVVIALILLVYFLYIKIMYPNVYRSLRHMTFLFSFVLVIVLAVLYDIALPYAGFIPSTAVFLAAMVLFLGERKWYIFVPVAVLTPLILYAIFRLGLNVRLP